MQPYLAVSDRAQRQVYGLGLFAAPLLMGASTFWWSDYGLGIVGGVLLVLSAVFWIVALLGMNELVRVRWRRTAAVMSVMVIYAGIAMSNFGLESVLAEGFRVAGGEFSRMELREALGVSVRIVMYVPGLSFPLSVVLLGVLLWRLNAIPAWCMVALCFSGLSFPLGRIPRIEGVAHATDLLLLVGLAPIAWRYLRARSATNGAGLREPVADHL